MTPSRERFAESVMRRINESKAQESLWHDRSARASLQASAASSATLGHPRFVDLSLGESGSTEAVAMFLDLRRFTARSFWDDPDEMVRVNVAVISELAAAVAAHGGNVLGFRGDGVFSCFDAEDNDPRVAAGFALAAAAFALDAVRSAVNNLLQMSGIEPVQVRAGMDYGRLDFVRIGTADRSEVNVLGFAANFAAKCEKAALAWEVVAGQGLAELLPADQIERHPESPTRYSRDHETRSYHYYQVSWTDYLTYGQHVPEELAGRSISQVVRVPRSLGADIGIRG